MESATARSRAEVVDEVSKWSVGTGILVMALAPLSLPILILTLVALLPLAVPLLAAGLLADVIALPVMLLRMLGRSVGRVSPFRRHEGASESAHSRRSGTEVAPG